MSEELTLLSILSENLPAFIAVGGTLAGTAIGAVLGANAAYKNDIRKAVHTKRQEFYFEFYEFVEKVLNDRVQVFDESYFQALVGFKARIKLISSEEVFKATESFYNFVRGYNHDYRKYCDSINPHLNSDNIEIGYTDYGERYEEDHTTDSEEEQFEELTKDYRKEHTPKLETVKEYVAPLYNAMRKDLGSEL